MLHNALYAWDRAERLFNLSFEVSFVFSSNCRSNLLCGFKRRKSLGDAYLQGVLDTLATLPGRVTNALARMGIEDCDALLSVGCDELKKIHCIGAMSIYQITCKMFELGFTEWAEEVRKKLFD